MYQVYPGRATTIALFTLPLIGLVLTLWSAWQLQQGIFIGANWGRGSGVIVEVFPGGPAAGLLFPGDRIISILERVAETPMPGSQAQRVAELSIERLGQNRSVLIPLRDIPLSVTLTRQIAPAVALVFWLVSVIVLAFKASGTQSRLFLLFCQSFAIALIAGALGANNLPYVWADRVFQILLWWVGPFAVHLHLYFPLQIPQRITRRVVLVLYLIAALGSIPSLLYDPLMLRSDVPVLYSASLLWLTLCLLGVVALLVRCYHRANTAESRRQIGLVATGASVALIPFFVLLLLPFALVRRPLVPVELTFVLMLAIPLTYGYAIVNYRLIRLDRYVSRSAAFTLVVTLLIGLYVVVNTALIQVVPQDVWAQQSAYMGLTLLLAVTCSVSYRRLQTSVDQMLYGGSYDYRSAVQRVSQALDQPSDREALAQTLCEGIQTSMQLECVRLLLPNQTKVLVLVGEACDARIQPADLIQVVPSSVLYRFFLEWAQPIDGTDLLRRVDRSALSSAERALLSNEHIRLWIPLIRSKELIGLCILGNKRGSESFDMNDLDILQVVTRLANTAIQNTQLIDDLRQRAIESEQLHQQILRAREEERKRVARELHDQIIQGLVGLNYYLSDMRMHPRPDMAEQISELQGNIRHTLDDVRRICADLRPPALDSLGLIPAIRSHLRDLERQGALTFVLDVTNDAQPRLPEDVSLCLYRVMQEAIVNVQKHAKATTVRVGIDVQLTEVCLTVQDNGRGFAVPQQLGHLVAGQHFGLVGLRERLDLVHGALSVQSQPRYGTCITARVPLQTQLS